MTSTKDSEVQAERKRLPGVKIDIQRLMFELLHSQSRGKVSLTVEHRPDVDTRQWWEIKWGEEPSALPRPSL